MTKKIISILFLICINSYLWSQNSPQPFKMSTITADDLEKMIDLPTGDFHYEIPLIHIPGPGGGYTVNLNYNAGIKMDQEASWVGLGWDICPGKITRYVNGVPDDDKDYYSTNISVAKANAEFSTKTTDLWFARFHKEKNGDKWKTNWDYSYIYFPGASFNTDFSSSFSIDVISTIQMLSGQALYDSYGIDLRRLGGGFEYSRFSFHNLFSNGNIGFNIEPEFNLDYVSITHPAFFGDPVEDKIGWFTTQTKYEVNWQWYLDQPKHTIGANYLGLAPHPVEGQEWGLQHYNYAMDMYTNVTSNEEDSRRSNNLSFPAYDYYIVNASGISGKITPIVFRDGNLLGSGGVADRDIQKIFQYISPPWETNERFSENTNFDINENRVNFVYSGDQHSKLQQELGDII